MKLNVQELKQFKSKSQAIPANNLLPILSYLKFEPGKVTKNSLQSFITMDIQCDSTMLIDEKQLMAFVNYTQAKEIDVTLKDGSVLITDGTKIKYTSPTEDANNFPVNDMPFGEWTDIDTGTLIDLSIASIFSVEDEANGFRSHVFIGNGIVASCDNFIAYLRERTTDNDIIITKQVAAIVGGLEDVKFNQNESYHFFTSGNCKYGFIKSQTPMVQFKPFITDLTGLDSFVISKKLLIGVNDLAINRSPLPQVIGALSCTTGWLSLSFTDSDYELSLKEVLPCTGGIEGVFNFNAGIFNRMLKSLPDDLLRFTLVANKLYVTCDNNSFISLIMRVQE